MSTIIIGGAGFIGSKLVSHFLEQGQQVLVIELACGGPHSRYAELAGVYGRMLAGSAHLLGDARDDPEGNEWWPWLKKIPGGADRRKTVALSSLRCARFYAGRHDWRRALRHGLYALITSPRQFINYGLSILRQWRAGIGNKDAPRHA
jgi:nucleoside-diphosphate-sugar epimerase